jgi:hypothetical protein
MDTQITLLSDDLAQLRDLSLQEMEQVSGGEFMNPREWIEACIVCLHVEALGLHLAQGPLT